ncbi:MAG: DegT/DnrJ/EryC1/StrS family aminotransferase [Cyclobacteriaceae bacterium]
MFEKNVNIPIINDFIPLASPDIRSEDIENVITVLQSGNLVQGKKVDQLEKAIAEYLHVDHCIAMNSGTSTLQLILLALGVGSGDEVIVPAFSYVATANVVENVGAKPIFVDIDVETFNINVQAVEESIGSRTKAIIPVHEFGLMVDTTPLMDLSEKHNLFVVEDAACALGAKDESQFAGTVGIAGSFSFHPRKAITSGEGGVVVTNEELLASKLRALRNHGIDSENTSRMDFIMAGYNCRMTDFQAAMLISQLNRSTEALKKRNHIASRYFEEIRNEKIQLPFIPKNKTPNWQTFHVMLREPLVQKEVIERLRKDGIGTNYGAQCIPEQSYYKNKYGYNCRIDFPNALRAYETGLALPIYEKLTDQEVTVIIENVNRL